MADHFKAVASGMEGKPAPDWSCYGVWAQVLGPAQQMVFVAKPGANPLDAFWDVFTYFCTPGCWVEGSQLCKWCWEFIGFDSHMTREASENYCYLGSKMNFY